MGVQMVIYPVEYFFGMFGCYWQFLLNFEPKKKNTCDWIPLLWGSAFIFSFVCDDNPYFPNLLVLISIYKATYMEIVFIKCPFGGYNYYCGPAGIVACSTAVI